LYTPAEECTGKVKKLKAWGVFNSSAATVSASSAHFFGSRDLMED
jgi:hypothetical protein